MNSNTPEYSFSPSQALSAYMQSVFQWMAIGLALTGFVAFWAAGNIALIKGLARGGFWVLAILEIGLVFWLTSSIQKISTPTATVGFLVYSFLNGLTLSFIFLVYTGASIALTFFLAAGTFAGVSMYAWATKADLSSMRGIFMMGLIGLIIASVVNLFLHSPVLYWIISYVGVGLFIGLTAYDIQKLKWIHQSGQGTGQLAILGALMLYLDFINLFIYLLRIFGRRRD